MANRTDMKLTPAGPEAGILLAGARRHADESALVHFCKDSGGRVDWGRLDRLAEFHGVEPLLYASLTKHVPTAVPARVLARLRARARANVHHCLLLTSELVKLMRRFEAANIVAIPFKGPVLAACAYGDVTARVFTDLDIFVSKSRIAEAARVVLAAGYLSASGDADAIAQAVGHDDLVAFRKAAHYTFYRPDGRSRVDLQWRVAADRYFAQALERPNFWEGEFSRLTIGGHEIRTFSPTDTLLVLCIHGSKHGWEKLKWLCDIAEVLRSQASSIRWHDLWRAASQLHVERMVRLGLILAGDLLGTSIPADAARAAASDGEARALAKELSDALFVENDGSPRCNDARFYLRLKDGWSERTRFHVRYVQQVASKVFAPTAMERELLSLPRSLSFVYYVFRPIRLSVKYAAASARVLRQKVSARV
jgi:hypothetical protein